MVIFFANHENVRADVNGDVRTITSGNWNNLAIWEKYNGAAWVAASAVPGTAEKQITIRSGHTVTVTAALTTDEVVVESGAVLVLNSGISLTLKKAAIPDLKIYGIFRNAGTVSIAGGTSITYYSGGRYQHNYTTTAGTIPVGVWNAGSTCEINAYTTNTAMPSGLNQTFNDLIWNCAGQTADVNFGGGMTTFTGNFIVTSTGTKELQLATSNYTLNITGNISVTGGILSGISVASKSITINQTGDFNMAGGTFKFATGNNCTGNLNLTGNYSQTGGTFNFGAGNSSTTSINNYGNFSQTGGTLTTSGSGAVGQVVFSKSGAQNFTASGNTVSGNVDYIVNAGSTCNLGTSVMTGRNLTVAATGELGIGSPDGINTGSTSGNVQVTGTRTYNATSYFLYNGTADQNSGNGLPASVYKLTINNGNFLMLTTNVVVGNIINFVSGKILTGTYEVQLTNTSAAAMTGYSSSSYIAGKLRRTISSSGTFDFPVGNFAMYELMTVTLTSTAGFTSLLGQAINAVTNDTLYPLTPVVSGIPMTEMLDFGYWTLTPNSPLTAGSYSIQLNESGFTNQLSGTTVYSLLVRNDASSSWQSIGTHNDNTQSVSGGVVTAVRSGMTAFYQYGIALGENPTFSSPSLIGGTSGNVGAVYLFQDIIRGVDAQIEIINLYNGASLTDIDNSATGYSESFQPFVTFPANKDSYIEWRISFKKADTNTDTILKKITATGVDVDGSSGIREYIVATMPTSYSLDSATLLTMSNDSGHYKALGPTFSVANIDTSHHEIMYQLNYNNVGGLLYRTGAVNTSASAETRQTSLFFRSFLVSFSNIYALPIELVDFKAELENEKVYLNWITASEQNNDYFTIERSSDNITYETLLTKRGAGNSTTRILYEAIDEYPLKGISYYRLKQTDFDGKFSYSEVELVVNEKNISDDPISIKSIGPNPIESDFQIEFFVKTRGAVSFNLFENTGKLIFQKRINVIEKFNTYRFDQLADLKRGTYLLVIEKDDMRITRKVLKK